MKSINIITPSLTFNSFSYCGKLTKQLLLSLTNNYYNPNNIFLSTSYSHGSLNLRIDDAFLTCIEARFSDIAWLDTALLIPRHNIRNQCKIVTCSSWDKEKLEAIGLKVDDVIPRPFNQLAYMFRNMRIPKEYDVFICGWYRDPDRKNFNYAYEIIEKLGLKYIALSNYPKFKYKLDFASVDDYTKFMLIAKSKYVLHLSGAEGFGMIPLEGMSIGIPAIYLDAPAHNEFAVGFKIPHNGFRDLNYTFGIYNVTCRSYIPNMDEAFEIVKQALDVYGKEEYEELSLKALEKADQMMMKVLSFLRSLIIT
jgi:hypothetical protein